VGAVAASGEGEAAQTTEEAMTMNLKRHPKILAMCHELASAGERLLQLPSHVDVESVVIDAFEVTPRKKEAWRRSIGRKWKETVVVWDLTTTQYHPASRWEPEDADTAEAGTFDSWGSALAEIAGLMASERIVNILQNEGEAAYFAEMEELERLGLPNRRGRGAARSSGFYIPTEAGMTRAAERNKRLRKPSKAVWKRYFGGKASKAEKAAVQAYLARLREDRG
jgi:hypothetical protein